MWVDLPIPLHRSQVLPAALLHLQDRCSAAHPRTVQPFHSDNQDTGHPQAKAAVHTTAGAAWDIVDPIFMRATRAIFPWATVFRLLSPCWNDEDDGDGPAQVAPPADYGNQPMGDYGPEAPEVPEVAANTPSPFRPAYQGQIEAAPVHAQPATTLIFKDGRPPVQVHNYALTASTLYALDGDSRQEIPLSQLDVPATVEANRKAGVDFALPVSR